MKEKPDYGFWTLWNLSFGFFGVQIAYALQSAQVSRIFSTIGADPHDLSYFWILPPLMGLIVQPVVGTLSDRTWNRFGRRLPYLLIGALVAILVMCFLPNAGSLGLSIGAAIMFGLVMLMLLDTSINMAMQPFKMLVGDFVNERQKGMAYSIQSFLCNAGSVVGFLAPIVLALFLSNTAPQGQVPPTVTWSFYIGAIVLLLCVIYTFAKVKEMPPAEYAAYHGLNEQKDDSSSENKSKEGFITILKKAPKVFWTVGLVQFFCWAAFLYMWTYSTDAIASQAFDAPSIQKVTGVTIDGKKYNDKYLLAGDKMLINDGKLAIDGIVIDGTPFTPLTVTINGDTVISGGQIHYTDGISAFNPGQQFAVAGQTIDVDGRQIKVEHSASTITSIENINGSQPLILSHIAKLDNGTGTYILEQTKQLPSVSSPSDIQINYQTVLNSSSKQYQDAGDWNGVLLAIQALAAVLWSVILSQFKNRKVGYSISLLIGAIGFASIYFIHSKWMLGISYGLVGCAWTAMLAMPFTILTNALSGKHIGTYLGLFNCTICFPQIIAALCGGLILSLFPNNPINDAPYTVWMLVVSGILLALGSCSVWNVKETYGNGAPSNGPMPSGH